MNIAKNLSLLSVVWDKTFHYTYWCPDHSYLEHSTAFWNIFTAFGTILHYPATTWESRDFINLPKTHQKLYRKLIEETENHLGRCHFRRLEVQISKPLQATTDVTNQNYHQIFVEEHLGNLHTKRQDDRTIGSQTTAILLHPVSEVPAQNWQPWTKLGKKH